jgi:predicted deacetylase
MRPLIIRDDDTSYFTPFEKLEAIYGALWAQNLPVCLAVIPSLRCDVRVLHREGAPYDPSIPPDYRGNPDTHLITENRSLCAFLNSKIRQGLVEICLHGYTHAYHEFASRDSDLLAAKVRDGLTLLREAFPAANIRTFIAPYDVMSPEAIRVVLDAGLSLCTASANLRRSAEVPHLPPYAATRLSEGTRLFTCDEYLFHHRDRAESCLANACARLQSADFFILSNHYWSFFHDWRSASTRSDLLKAWHTFAAEAVRQRHVTTFQSAPL